MVAIKNIAFAASCVASALAAPATKRQDWGNGGQMGGWGGQAQGQDQGQAWGQSQGQGQDAGASSGAATGSGEVASVPITNDGQSSAGAVAGNSSSPSDSTAAVDSNAGAAGSTSLAAVSGETLTTSSTGNAGDYYYSHWVETNSGATMTVGSGSYSLEWTEASGNVVSGIGWNPASAK